VPRNSKTEHASWSFPFATLNVALCRLSLFEKLEERMRERTQDLREDKPTVRNFEKGTKEKIPITKA
jgi:hypothetical protein